MKLSVGQIVDGEVSNIMKFGAFVDLGDKQSGLVHISEISDDYVEKVSDFLEKGQKVKVKVLSIDESGKIALSIKDAEEKKKVENTDFPKEKQQEKDLSFEDKIAKFLKDSNEKLEKARSRENFKISNRSRSR
jgi:S1 RNA binding domain protein